MGTTKLPACVTLWTEDLVRWAIPESAGQQSLLEPNPEQRSYRIEARYAPSVDTLRLYVMGAENWRTAAIPIDRGDHEACEKSLAEYREVVRRLRYHETEKEARLAWRALHRDRAAD